MGQSITAAGIGEIVSAHERFVLLSHTRPDGDAIGSEVALKSVLESLGKSAQALNEDGVPDNLTFMAGSEQVERPSGPVEADVVIALDTANRERLGGNCLEAVGEGKLWVNIDHHISNEEYGDHFLVEPGAAATGEVLYGLFRELDWPVPEVARDALYIALSPTRDRFSIPIRQCARTRWRLIWWGGGWMWRSSRPSFTMITRSAGLSSCRPSCKRCA